MICDVTQMVGGEDGVGELIECVGVGFLDGIDEVVESDGDVHGRGIGHEGNHRLTLDPRQPSVDRRIAS